MARGNKIKITDATLNTPSGSNHSKRRKYSLSGARASLQVLVDEANRRVRNLTTTVDNDGNLLMSRALSEAQKSFARQTSRAGETELFKSDFKRSREINREYARVTSFLNDYTSTIEGAKNITSSLKNLEGAFSGEWKEVTGENYDTSRINSDSASTAFSLYRSFLEESGGWERAIGPYKGVEGLIGYGSDTLIQAIYDMVENNYSHESILNIAREMFNTAEQTYLRLAELGISNNDYGNIITQSDADKVNYLRRKYGG